MSESIGICPVIWTLVFGGLLGGLVNSMRELRPNLEKGVAPTPWSALLLTCALPIAQGIAAAGVVPLFLSLTKSTLLEDALTVDTDRAVLFGLAVVASVSAKAFLDSITKRALQDIKENKEAIADTREKVDSLESELDEGEGSAVDTGSRVEPFIADQPQLSKDENQVLKVMRDSKWIKRTAAGLEREVTLESPGIQEVLDLLTSKRLLKRHEPTKTQKNLRWSLSPFGKQAAAALPDVGKGTT